MDRVTSQNNRDHLLFNGYKFRKDKILLDGTTAWRCLKRSCTGRLKVSVTDSIVSSSEHNHKQPIDSNLSLLHDNHKSEVKQVGNAIPFTVDTQRMVPFQIEQQKVDKTLSKLDLKIYKIWHKEIDDDCEKAKLYSNSLSSCLKSLRPNVTTAKDFDVVEQDDPTETLETLVMNTVPKTWKSRASRLLNHLQNIPNVSWRERGELILKQRLIPKTQLIDLVNDLIRKRATITAPVGCKQLANVLRKSNVPQERLGNKDRLKYINTASQRNFTTEHMKTELVWSKY